MKTNKKNIIGLAAVLTLAIAAIAFAHEGYGRHMGGSGGHMMGPGYGDHMMGYDFNDGRYMRGDDARGDLSDEEAAKLEASQKQFFEDTRELRGQIDEMQIAMRNEMSRDNPDRDKIFELQKQVSVMQSDFDQKALAHQLEVRQLLPDNYRVSGYGRGYCW